MAQSPKSPKSPGAKFNYNEESTFWEKLGTLGRKKNIKKGENSVFVRGAQNFFQIWKFFVSYARAKNVSRPMKNFFSILVQDVQEEGKYAIDSPGKPNAPEIPPEDYNLNDNEQRSIIQPQCLNFPDVRDLLQTLVDWINDELVEERIIVSNIEQDLYDGQVLHKLFEKLTGNTLNVLEVTQSEEGQRQKLTVVLNAVNHVSSLGCCRFEVTQLFIFRPSASITQLQNGPSKAFTPRTSFPSCICWSPSSATSEHRFAFQKTFPSPSL